MIISENYPYLKVKFNIGAYESRISAYLDTGFDGYLVVPISLASSLGQGDYLARWELGDGCIVEAFEYLGVLEIVGLGTAIKARITLLGNDYLVGRGLIE